MKAVYSAIPIVLGIIILLSYLNNAAGLIDLPNKLVLMLFFAIGPVAIVGITKLSGELEQFAKGLTLKAGTVFLIIGFALLNLMLVVQQTIFIMMDKFTTEAADAATAASLKPVLQGVNLVQIGMDVSFDIFYCLGMILFASAMFRHPNFGKILGIAGIAIGSALLAFNMHTFPIPPAEAGSYDLGPVSGLWWLTVIVVDLIRKRNKVVPV
jgi:hypothetical protein